MGTYLAEHYWPGVTVDGFARAARSVARAAEEMAATGHPIRFLHSTLVPEDEAALCVFDAASAELVAEAYRVAGVRVERIVEAVTSDSAGRLTPFRADARVLTPDSDARGRKR